jgi:amidohydrolase
MTELASRIRAMSATILPEVVAMRRHLHAHPELSFAEHETSAWIQQKLSSWGIPFETGYADTGISALISPEKPGEPVALRADMDALPIRELNDVPYKSTRDGVMHACGHDAHTACLLGAAKILHDLRGELPRPVQLIFQPAEERLPGGASLMIADGVFAKRPPAAIFGQHVYPELPAGKVGFRAGPYMASTDEIYVTVTGRGGHGARPHANIDPVLIASHLVVALQQAVSRWADPQMPTVLTFGRIIGEGATNITPDSVYLEGTFRTFDEPWRRQAHERMIRLAHGLAEGMGATVSFRIEVGYPVVVNDEALTATARARAEEYLGAENVVDLPMRTTAEDFAYYTRIMPGCFYRLGTASADGGNAAALHNARFNIDEKALETGTGLLAWLAAGPGAAVM